MLILTIELILILVCTFALFLIQFTHMLGRAFFQGSNKLHALGILFTSGILGQTFGITCLNFGTRRIAQGIHGFVVACRDLDK